MGLSFAEYVLTSSEALESLRQAYLDDVTEGGTWGSELEARHLAECFEVRVVFWVANAEGKFKSVHRYGSKGAELHLLNAGNHFEALRAVPVENAVFERTHVTTNSGEGDCLYRAFHQALRRNSEEPSLTALKGYRRVVAENMRKEEELDLQGLLVTLLDEFETWGFALGSGHALQSEIATLYERYRQVAVEGGGSIPPFGRTERSGLKLGMRDIVPRGELSRADRMIDRIGRLVATQESVHVAVALDGNTLVMSCNDDTVEVLKALNKLIARHGKRDGSGDDDPLHGVEEGILRVKSTTKFGGTDKLRRVIDVKKLKALESGVLEELSSGSTASKLSKIKAALKAGCLVDIDGGKSAKQQYWDGQVGIYFIPHVPRTRTTGVVHGEINVTDAIQERRTGKKLEDDVFIGGTLIDCFDCNASHKGRNAKLKEVGEKWRFYSGGTHGNSFPNWYVQPSSRTRLDEPTFKSQRFPGTSAEIVLYEDEEYWTRETVRQYYFWNGRRNVDTDYSHSPRGKLNPSYNKSVDVRRVRSVPKTFLTEMFLREKCKSHMKKEHSSFADDSDSDTEDYELVLTTRKKKRVERALKLRRNYDKLSGAQLCTLFTDQPIFTLPVMVPKVTPPLLQGALIVYQGQPPCAETELFVPPLELCELLATFSRTRLDDLFEAALRVELPLSGRRVSAPSSVRRALTDVASSYALEVRPLGDVIDRLGTIWALPAGDFQTLITEPIENAGFNLGALYGLFSLAIVIAGGMVVDSHAPLYEVWDAIFQRTFSAYVDGQMSDWVLVLQVRTLVYLMLALRITRLGERSLASVLELVRSHAA